jgi:hypothetical protein
MTMFFITHCMAALSRCLLDAGSFGQPYARNESKSHRSQLALPPLSSPSWQSPLRAFAWGMSSVASTVLTLVLFATYLGIGALAHDSHFSLAGRSAARSWSGRVRRRSS